MMPPECSDFYCFDHNPIFKNVNILHPFAVYKVAAKVLKILETQF